MFESGGYRFEIVDMDGTEWIGRWSARCLSGGSVCDGSDGAARSGAELGGDSEPDVVIDASCHAQPSSSKGCASDRRGESERRISPPPRFITRRRCKSERTEAPHQSNRVMRLDPHSATR